MWWVWIGLFLTYAPAVAQETAPTVATSAPDIRVEIRGAFQPRLSYGFTSGTPDDIERLGLGIRRARLRATTTVASRFGAHYDVDIGSGTLTSIDLFGFYSPSPHWLLRFGYLAGAQPRAATFTSMTQIDAVDRAAIAERWARGTIGSSGRDFGVEARFQTATTRFHLFLHNGDGSFSRTRGNFRESASGGDATRGIDRTDFAVSTYLGYMPSALAGLEVGAFAGYNGSENPNTAAAEGADGRAYSTYAAHVYWGANPGSQPVRLKADLLGIHYEAPDGSSLDAQHLIGYSMMGAVRLLNNGEAFARYEGLHPFADEGADTYLTAGLSYSLSARRGEAYHRERVTLAYANAYPDSAEPARQHLVVLQFQFVF